jgi:uncharacterized protein YbjT (DUF2867 family)
MSICTFAIATIASVAATVLRDPADHGGKKYNLSVEVLSVPEIAMVLTDVIGKPFHSVPHSPDEFLEAVLKTGMEPNYARSAHETLVRFGKEAVPGETDVFDNFEMIAGKKPTMWRDFAAKHRDEFLLLESDTATA